MVMRTKKDGRKLLMGMVSRLFDRRGAETVRGKAMAYACEDAKSDTGG